MLFWQGAFGPCSLCKGKQAWIFDPVDARGMYRYIFPFAKGLYMLS